MPFTCVLCKSDRVPDCGYGGPVRCPDCGSVYEYDEGAMLVEAGVIGQGDMIATLVQQIETLRNTLARERNAQLEGLSFVLRGGTLLVPDNVVIANLVVHSGASVACRQPEVLNTADTNSR